MAMNLSPVYEGYDSMIITLFPRIPNPKSLFSYARN